MKNKRNVLIAFILICCLCLSIGYARLSDVLTVNGTATVNVISDNDGGEDDPTTPIEKAFEEEVYWLNANNSGKTGVTAFVDTTADSTMDTVKITVDKDVLVKEGDTVVVYATIINKSDYNAAVTLKNVAATTDEATKGTFKVDCKWPDTGFNGIIEEHNGTAVVEIKITMVNAPISDYTYEFRVGFDVEATTEAAGVSGTFGDI